MLTIREDQFRALETTSIAEFTHRMCQHLQRLFGDQLTFLDGEDLGRWVLHWISEARKWNIDTEPAVEQFLELCVCHQELRHLKESPWIIEVLEYPGRSAESKLSRLTERLIFSSEHTAE